MHNILSLTRHWLLVIWMTQVLLKALSPTVLATDALLVMLEFLTVMGHLEAISQEKHFLYRIQLIAKQIGVFI